MVTEDGTKKFWFYRWDIQQFNDDPKVRRWTLADRGLYHHMLDALYLGYKLPDSVEGVAEATGLDADEIQPSWSRVRRKFDAVDGYLTHDQVQAAKAEKAEESERQSTNAKKRWDKKAKGEKEPAKAAKPVESKAPQAKTDANTNVLVDALRAGAGDALEVGVVTEKQAAVLAGYDAATLKLVGEYIAAGQHWVTRKEGTTVLGFHRVVAANFDGVVGDARTWAKNGRKGPTKKNGMAAPCAPMTATREVTDF